MPPPATTRQISDLVDDEQQGSAEEADLLLKPTFTFAPSESRDEFGERGEIDALSSLDGFDAEGDRQMALAGAGRPE